MLNKIDKDMNDFAFNIKTIESHEELLGYMNSNLYASIKLLVFASKSFTLYGRILLFFVITLAGLLILSGIEAMGSNFHTVLNPSYILLANLGLYILILAYIMHYKKLLISYIAWYSPQFVIVFTKSPFFKC